MNQYKRFSYVDPDDTFHNTKCTSWNAAWSSYHTILPCVLHSEVCLVSDWSTHPHFSICFRISNFSIFGAAMIIQFFHLCQINYQSSCNFVSLLQNIQLSQLWEELLGADCIPNRHCSTHFREIFLHTKKLALWVCTSLEDKLSIPQYSYQKRSQFFMSISIWNLNIL